MASAPSYDEGGGESDGHSNLIARTNKAVAGSIRPLRGCE
jgi:hypothetical protein